LGAKKYPEGVSHLSPGRIPGIYIRTPPPQKKNPNGVQHLSPGRIPGFKGRIPGIYPNTKTKKEPQRSSTSKPRENPWVQGENPRDISEHQNKKKNPNGVQHLRPQSTPLGCGMGMCLGALFPGLHPGLLCWTPLAAFCFCIVFTHTKWKKTFFLYSAFSAVKLSIFFVFAVEISKQ